MKKLLSLALVTVLAFGCLASCKKDKPSSNDDQPVREGYWVNDDKTYSYRLGPSDLPTAWNIQTYQANQATYILDYTEDALYVFDYNDDYTGYKIVPSMADGDPVDVSADYAAQFGYSSTLKGKAYKIKLKDTLLFDNGDKIDADTFVESMKLLLDPKASNYRASDVYQAGNLKILNAENYAKQGSWVASDIMVSENFGDDEYVNPSKFVADKDGYLTYNDKVLGIDLTSGGNWGDNGLYDYADAGKFDYKDGETTSTYAAWTTLKNAADANGIVRLKADTLKALQDCVAILHGYADVEAYAAKTKDMKDGVNYAYVEFEEMAAYARYIDEVSFDKVGFLKGDNDLELVVVLQNEMEDNFYLRYGLCTSFFLVNPDLYKSCISYQGDVYQNSYGTSVATYSGYGPYKLSTYVADSQIVLTRNVKWHGYYEEEHKGQYQTNRIVYKMVTEDATRKEMFLKGELDSYSLRAEDMADYYTSDYTYFNDSESTWYIAMNPSASKLAEAQKTATPVTAGNAVIKTVLAIDEFRQALSYSLDRKSFIQTLFPTSGVAKYLLSSMIIADPETGKTYRSTEEAKDAVLDFWGLTDKVGEGKQFATKDDAIASITGYDLSGAKALFDQAYDEAVARGYITSEQVASGKWEVQVLIGRPSAANAYEKGFEELKKVWTAAVKDTAFEGHLTFTQSAPLGQGFGEALRAGQVDLLWGVGYGGSMFDPYSMIECFTGKLAYDSDTDKTKIDLDITLDLDGNGEKTYRASLYDWASKALMGTAIQAKVVENGEVTDKTATINAGVNAASEIRINVLAAVEGKIMKTANIFPLMTDATASLKCMRINYKTEEYILGVGRGGVQYYTYAMDDDTFLNYAKNQPGGVINYK